MSETEKGTETGTGTVRAATRVLEVHEHRAALDLFRDSLHMPPVSDADWPVLEASLEPASVRGAFSGSGSGSGSRLVGVHQATASDVVVPGDARVAVELHHRFAVRNGHTRSGVGRSLMTAALRSATAPLAMLRASEGGIYGRYGFAVATRCRELVVDRRRARLSEHVPAGHHTYAPAAGEIAALLPVAYEGSRGGAGTVSRPGWYEALLTQDLESAGGFVRAFVHSGPEGEDGFARYAVRRVGGDGPAARTVLEVLDMHHGTPQAWAGLWRSLLDVELVDEIRARQRPLDEPVEWLFTDPHVCRTGAVDDETWLRLTDVGAALRARRFEGAGTVVIGVEDALLPANSGHYRVGPETAGGAGSGPQISGSVAAWSALYLGAVRPSALAATGALRVHDPRALKTADELFWAGREPWCGTYI
ncbi:MULTISPECIES: GNAT family N-acetyltransferase [Streptomyces]|uniref:GNAT family N-acetyltransferase n=1 Tax=Streptomyces lycopersici TaxID=2974589 RepID=UPI0021D0AEDB|nr:GNAT family N-acetyltransferase [Streptomyces sp. NEAU-383]